MRADEEKERDSGAGKDSEDDDVDVDEEEPVPFKESLKKKWLSRQAEDARESPSDSAAVPPSSNVTAESPAAASDKGGPNLFAIHPLMERSLANLKPPSFLTKAT